MMQPMMMDMVRMLSLCIFLVQKKGLYKNSIIIIISNENHLSPKRIDLSFSLFSLHDAAASRRSAPPLAAAHEKFKFLRGRAETVVERSSSRPRHGKKSGQRVEFLRS